MFLYQGIRESLFLYLIFNETSHVFQRISNFLIIYLILLFNIPFKYTGPDKIKLEYHWK